SVLFVSGSDRQQLGPSFPGTALLERGQVDGAECESNGVGQSSSSEVRHPRSLGGPARAWDPERVERSSRQGPARRRREVRWAAGQGMRSANGASVMPAGLIIRVAMVTQFFFRSTVAQRLGGARYNST